MKDNYREYQLLIDNAKEIIIAQDGWGIIVLPKRRGAPTWFVPFVCLTPAQKARALACSQDPFGVRPWLAIIQIAFD